MRAIRMKLFGVPFTFRPKLLDCLAGYTQPYFMMAKAGFLEAVGEANITTDLPTAILRAKALQADGSAEVRK